MSAMRLPEELVEDVAYHLYGRALKWYPPDVKATLREAAGREVDGTAQEVLAVALKAIDRGEQLDKPVCQDTGLQTVWIRVGRGVELDGTAVTDAVRRGISRWTSEHEYRRTIAGL